MRILMTGAAGLLGTMLAEELENKYQLRLADVIPGSARGEWVGADVTVPMDMYRATEGVDLLVHLAAWHCLKEPPFSTEAILQELRRKEAAGEEIRRKIRQE